MTKRRNISDTFKAAVALEALRGDKTVQEIAAMDERAHDALLQTRIGGWCVPDSSQIACEAGKRKR